MMGNNKPLSEKINKDNYTGEGYEYWHEENYIYADELKATNKRIIERLKKDPWDIGDRAPDVRDAEWIRIVERRVDKIFKEEMGDNLI